MPEPTLQAGRHLLASFAVVVAGFVTATITAELASRDIGDHAESLARNGLPSLRSLLTVRAELHALALDVARDRPESEGGLEAARESMERLERELDTYFRLPAYPGEEDRWPQLRALLADLRAGLADRGPGSREPLRQAVHRCYVETTELLDINQRWASLEAEQIDQQRRRSIARALALDGLCVLLTGFIAMRVRRALRREAELTTERNRLLAERASELEMFAGRVAHDILNPLAGVKLAVDLMRRGDEAPEAQAETIQRAGASVRRVQRIVDGLLSFARAGARPTPGAEVELGDVLVDVVSDLGPTAEAAEAQLVLEAAPECSVACSPGILTSLVSNLVSNAIKYLDDAPVRRVVVRGSVRDRMARVEVEDTGPGLPAGFASAVFEPYVRGRESGKPGIGLGLATVKRAAEAHGGRVGVESAPGHGARFWFELPCGALRAVTREAAAGGKSR